MRDKQAVTNCAESDAAHQRPSQAQTPVGDWAQLCSPPGTWGDRSQDATGVGGVLPSDGFLAVGEHHHICVHLVNRGDMVALALAWAIINLPC